MFYFYTSWKIDGFRGYTNKKLTSNGLIETEIFVLLLTFFFPMFPFDIRENIRKFLVFWCFQGDQKETFGRKWLKKDSMSFKLTWDKPKSQTFFTDLFFYCFKLRSSPVSHDFFFTWRKLRPKFLQCWFVVSQKMTLREWIYEFKRIK